MYYIIICSILKQKQANKIDGASN